MSTIILLSCFIYRRVLILYPPELRARFGTEMAEVFDDLMGEAMLQHGFAGAASLWRTASWELLSVALPLRLRNMPVLAGALSLASALAWAFFRAVG